MIIHGNYNAVITKSTDLANRWIGSFDPSQPIINDNLNDNPSSSLPPIEALQAIQATHRWADNFVRQLNLCPWAGSSLDVPDAICYWILLVDNDNSDDSLLAEEEEEKLLDKMEMVVREAGVQLTLATTPNSDDGTSNDKDAAQFIDPSVAISFIVLVPINSSKSNNIVQSNFGTFHEFFIDLEDRLLDECDDYWDLMDSLDNDDDERDNYIDDPNLSSLGCDITIAAFHPKWQFNSNDEEDDAAGNAIDYEKRTPYPTISIVMSSVIEGLMKERDSSSGQDDSSSSSSALATERIADLNEKTLCSIGVERLKELFDTEVLACPLGGQATITDEDESR